MLLTRLVVLGVYLSLAIEIAYSVDKKKKDDGVFECIVEQICNCKTIEKWEECWGRFIDVTSTWIVNRTHQCEKGGNFPFGTFGDIVTHMCSLQKDEFKECYYEVSEAFKVYLNEVNMDPEKEKESNQIEEARMCAGTNLLQCSQFGTGC